MALAIKMQVRKNDHFFELALFQAISCLKRSLWLQPLNWKTLYNASLAYLSTLQPASAFNFACASVNLRPDVADSFTLLAGTKLKGFQQNSKETYFQ